MTVADGTALPDSPRDPDGDLNLVVTTREPGQIAVLTVSGEVDLLTARRLHESLQRVLDTGPRIMVLDLTQVSFFGSSGLAVLAECRQLTGDRTDIRVVATGPALRPLQLTGLTDMFAVRPTLQAALEIT